MPPRTAGFLVHFFTACGAALGFAALLAAVGGQYSAMFAWLGAALAIDAADGSFARRYKVEETAPHIDGVVLDLVVDYLNYVVVPLVALWGSGLLLPPLAVFVCCVVCAASALYFADRRIKTHDLWFRGFPAIWNILIFYILVLRPGPLVTTLVILVFAGLMFAPIAFVHPLRVLRLRLVTITLTVMWCVAAIAAVIQGLPEAGFLVKAVLIVVALYYIFLPLFRNFPKA
ncbi:MAG: CDP-alcohol phosphatidyltransferase family protein [Methylocella sp.]